LFVAREHNLQLSFAHMIDDLIRNHTRDAAPLDGGGHRAADAVDHQPSSELD